MKTIILLATTILTAQMAFAEPESVDINLPDGVVLRKVTNKTTVPIKNNSGQDQHCTAEITLLKFQSENPEGVSLAMKRLTLEWFKVGLRSVNSFLKGTADKETCQSEYFSAYQIKLDYDFTAQYGSMVSMVIDNYISQGGTHGFVGIDKVLLNFSTGKEIPGTLDTFFKNDKVSTLISLLETKLKKEGVDLSLGWSEAKKEITEMSKVTNFYFTPKGMTFFWNPYLIGPFASGIIEVEISWKEITDHELKNNSDYSATLPQK